MDIGSTIFHQDVELHPETDDHNKLLGSYLYLQHARVNNSGTYMCELTTYPQGTIGRTTHLNVTDAEVTCDHNSTLELGVGENVTVHCELRLHPQAEYRWLKNHTLVSETQYLEIRWMDESQAGVYILTVSAGSRSLQRSFNITTHSRTSTRTS
ncbi:hypothetical protein CRUP_035921 [Coryphaenoides rupestris]|nr:hypothetical protein CRUP_035921 [Coryphaenoides rupestris]